MQINETMSEALASSPDLSLSEETILFLTRILPGYEVCPRISALLQTNIFPAVE